MFEASVENRTFKTSSHSALNILHWPILTINIWLPWPDSLLGFVINKAEICFFVKENHLLCLTGIKVSILSHLYQLKSAFSLYYFLKNSTNYFSIFQLLYESHLASITKFPFQRYSLLLLVWTQSFLKQAWFLLCSSNGKEKIIILN